MFFITVFLCCAACVLGAPAPTDVVPLEKQQPTVIPIVSQSDELEPNGTYHFSYETGNGIKREEISYDKVVPKVRSSSSDSNEGGEDGDSDEIHVQRGSYSYTAPDGTVISVRYIADENGFQPIGDHIPRVPSVSSGSGEKSGRALNVADNAGSGSAPVAAAKPVEKPESKPAAAPLSAAAPASPSAEGASTTPAAENEATIKTAEAEAITTEVVKTSDVPTTESSSTVQSSEVTTEGATTEAAKVTESEPSTTAAAAVEASTPAAEQSTANSEPSTTEAASITTAAA